MGRPSVRLEYLLEIFWIRRPSKHQISLKAFWGNDMIPLWLCTTVEEKRESHFLDPINPLRMKELRKKNDNSRV